MISYNQNQKLLEDIGGYSKNEVQHAYTQEKRRTGKIKGPNGLSESAYEGRRHFNVKRIRKKLNDGVFVHGAIKIQTNIHNGKERVYSIANFDDRIANRLIARRLADLNFYLHPAAAAYRSKASVACIIKDLREVLDSCSAILTFDIKNAFPTTTDDLIIAALNRIPIQKVQKRYLLNFIESPERNWSGLPVGLPFSQDLYNHALRPLDDELEKISFFYRRYSDNFLLAFDETSCLQQAPSIALKIVEEIGEWKVHEVVLRNPKKEVITVLGIDIHPDGSLSPTPNKIHVFREKLETDASYRMILGWVSHYRNIGVSKMEINRILRSCGVPNIFCFL